MTMNRALLRQSDIIPVEVLSRKITIIGAGAVGSWTALSLAKMGFLNLTVWDADSIEEENMNCQFYPISDLTKPKVSALNSMIQFFTHHEIGTKESYWRPEDGLTDDYIIAAVDDMGVRKQIFESCGPTVKYVLDPRMGAETMHLYTFNPHCQEDKEAYQNSWYSNDDSVHEACTAKSTIYCANLLSGLVAKTVKNLACSETYPRVLRWDLNGEAPMYAGFECWVKS